MVIWSEWSGLARTRLPYIPPMRNRRAGATAGTVDPRFPLSRRTLVRVCLLAAALWMAWAFVQEGWTASRLSAQALDLRTRNAALEAQNQQYVRDISTVDSGGASEEVARENGYAKPGEHVYVVGAPSPGPAAAPPPPAAHAVVTIHATSAGPLDGLSRWWSGLWPHRG